MGISSPDCSSGILGHQRVSVLRCLLCLREVPKVCHITVTGLEDHILQILLLSVVVSGKGNCCNSCQSAFPGPGEKTKLPIREWKGWLLFSPLFFFFPLTHVAFPCFVGIRRSAYLQGGIRDLQDVKNAVL